MRNRLPVTLNERRTLLLRILRKKVRYLPEKTLEQCVSNLNPNRLYIIRTTESLQKFNNIATSEFIASSNRKILSLVTVLHGNFLPGYFHETSIEKVVGKGVFYDEGPVIALKCSVYNIGEEISKTYTLIILDRAG